jgi:hypothetical protein
VYNNVIGRVLARYCQVHAKGFSPAITGGSFLLINICMGIRISSLLKLVSQKTS